MQGYRDIINYKILLKKGEKMILKEIFQESIKLKQKLINDENLWIELNNIIKKIINAIDSGNKILIMGNGGSAADAQHFAGEFINRFLMEREPLPAIALSTDTSVITCIGNDYSFDLIFEKQVKALAKKGDILFGITTSGNSKNIIKAFEAGKKIGTINIGLLGKNGGKAKDYVDHAIIVKSNSTPRIQEIHITLIHIICEIVEKEVAKYQ